MGLFWCRDNFVGVGWANIHKGLKEGKIKDIKTILRKFIVQTPLLDLVDPLWCGKIHIQKN
jgi:hypothetical protein